MRRRLFFEVPATSLQLDSAREQSSARGFVFFRRHFLLAHKRSSISLQTMTDSNEGTGSFE